MTSKVMDRRQENRNRLNSGTAQKAIQKNFRRAYNDFDLETERMRRQHREEIRQANEKIELLKSQARIISRKMRSRNHFHASEFTDLALKINNCHNTVQFIKLVEQWNALMTAVTK